MRSRLTGCLSMVLRGPDRQHGTFSALDDWRNAWTTYILLSPSQRQTPILSLIDRSREPEVDADHDLGLSTHLQTTVRREGPLVCVAARCHRTGNKWVDKFTIVVTPSELSRL